MEKTIERPTTRGTRITMMHLHKGIKTVVSKDVVLMFNGKDIEIVKKAV